MGDSTVVKDRIGRNRYVAFRVEGGGNVQVGEVTQALRDVSRSLPEEARPGLVRFQDGLGLVRVSHRHKEDTIRLLRSLRTIGERAVRVRTLGTTGTIRKAIRAYFGPPRR